MYLFVFTSMRKTQKPVQLICGCVNFTHKYFRFFPKLKNVEEKKMITKFKDTHLKDIARDMME